MKLKQIIVVVLLTLLLVINFYLLLEVIDRHLGILLIIILSLTAVSDIIVLARFYFRFMNTSGRPKH